MCALLNNGFETPCPPRCGPGGRFQALARCDRRNVGYTAHTTTAAAHQRLMFTVLRFPGLVALACTFNTVQAAPVTYEVHYRAEVQPDTRRIHMELPLSGEQLPRQLEFGIDPHRHKSFAATGRIAVTDKLITWEPQAPASHLSYDFIVNHERSSGSFDAL